MLREGLSDRARGGRGGGEREGPCSVWSPCSPQSGRKAPGFSQPCPAWPSLALGTPGWLMLVKQGLQQEALSAKLSAQTNIWKPEEAGRGACPTPPGGPGSFCTQHKRLHILPPPGKPLSSPRFLYLINTSLPPPNRTPLLLPPPNYGARLTSAGWAPSDTGICPFPRPESLWGLTPPQMHFLSRLPRGIDTHCPHPGSRAGCERVPSGSSEHLILLVSVTGSGREG